METNHLCKFYLLLESHGYKVIIDSKRALRRIGKTYKFVKCLLCAHVYMVFKKGLMKKKHKIINIRVCKHWRLRVNVKN